MTIAEAAQEIYDAATTMRTLPGPAAEPIARLLDALADRLYDEGGAFREEAVATARAINGGAQ